MKRIREFLESIAYTGLKPSGGTSAAPKSGLRWLGPLQGPVERVISGGPAPNDPLYLSNRTAAQKLKTWSLVAIPCLFLATGIGVTLYLLDPPEPKPIKQPTVAEIAGNLPKVGKDDKIAPTNDLQLIEIVVSNSRVSGAVQNTSKRDIAAAELVIDLANSLDSQVGAVRVTLEKIPASGRRSFALSIQQHDATKAMIREIIER
jgi:hypothetical protein